LVNADAGQAVGMIAAIGNFDGVHRGHQHLLNEAATFAKSHGAALGVVLFEPHPRHYFRPDDLPFLLTSTAQRDRLLRAHGVDKIFALTFDKTLANLLPKEFVESVLKHRLGLQGIIAGADFRFGAARAGDGEALKQIGGALGLNVQLASLLIEDNNEAEKLGSSAVREAIGAGDVVRAAYILGRRWSVIGHVKEGQKLGRTLGFATANITLGDYIAPRNGVYATLAIVDGQNYNAVSNYGRRPTVGSDAPLLETHLIDFDGDLYGKEVEVCFVDFIRDEKKFDGLEALQEQIAKDCAVAKNILR